MKWNRASEESTIELRIVPMERIIASSRFTKSRFVVPTCRPELTDACFVRSSSAGLALMDKIHDSHPSWCPRAFAILLTKTGKRPVRTFRRHVNRSMGLGKHQPQRDVGHAQAAIVLTSSDFSTSYFVLYWAAQYKRPFRTDLLGSKSFRRVMQS